MERGAGVELGECDGRSVHTDFRGLPCRRQSRHVQGLSRREIPGRVRCLAEQVLQSLLQPHVRHQGEELERRAPHRRTGGGRLRRRGHLPQHHSPVLPDGRGDRTSAHTGGVRTSSRRNPGPQSMAGRLVCGAAGATGGYRTDLPQRHRRHDRRRPVVPRPWPSGWDPAPAGSRRHEASGPSVLAVIRSIVGGVPGARRRGEHPFRGERACRTTGPTRLPGRCGSPRRPSSPTGLFPIC